MNIPRPTHPTPDHLLDQWNRTDLTDRAKVSTFYSWSSLNRFVLSAYIHCGCFYCLKLFDVDEIEEWVRDKGGDTALCPNCGVDSVIPNPHPSLDFPDMLSQMHETYFKTPPADAWELTPNPLLTPHVPLQAPSVGDPYSQS